jgi:exopolysaccharide biosynthesis polyprenyl glycosylphosphotransferase
MKASYLEKILLLISDGISFFLCYYFAYWVQFHSGLISEKFDPTKNFQDYINPGLVLCAVWYFLFAFTGLYRKWLLESRTYQMFRVFRTLVFGVMLMLVALFGEEWIARAFNDFPTRFLYSPRFLLVLGYGLMMIFLTGFFRLMVQVILRQFLARGLGRDPVLVLGANQTGARFVRDLERAPELGQRVVGFVDEHYSSMDKTYMGLPVLGKYSDLKDLIKAHKITAIVISHESNSHNEILRILVNIATSPIHVYVVPDLYDVISGHFKASFVHGIEIKELFAHHMPTWQVRVKRFMDIGVAAFLLFITFPALLLAALFIKLDSKGPIFYSQERVGLYGAKFKIWKFRTMRTDAESAGPQWATKRDPRITRIGQFLRKTRIDEIPQLWCVLKGEMSMVGPRPEREFFIEQLRHEIPFYISRLKMKPGLTGWAQVRHHYDTSIEDVQTKLRYDLYYFENMSLLLDFQILVRTVWVVLTGSGAQ